ncbi:choice-of-anchor H family protein [Woeseia oceani]|uniref:GlyGly-CTERM sorting domain-containing protein n=1 Tax=Woeseia oceani TaxID=1548547 RepID=A0A193LCV9_9GAMM|nr:choice-of-anchor H family protein [Woeseia oceani]ANO50281.1 hypothetical protein BA177_02755 [Woeseia oceani]
MSTQYKLAKMLTIAGLGGLLALPFAAVTAYAQAASSVNDNEVRVTASRQIVRGGRDGAATETVRHEFPALQTAGARQNSAAEKLSGASSVTRSQAISDDFWFYDADVILFNDFDNDGFFYGIDLLFDADTYFEAADVYAVVYLSLEGGPWNEYAATDDFTIYGASSDDEYVIVTELESGYPAGSYDLLIELYDAFDGTFLAEYGPVDSSALSFLDLEDRVRDRPYVEEVVVIGHGGGNGFGLLGMLVLPLLARRFSALRRKALA